MQTRSKLPPATHGRRRAAFATRRLTMRMSPLFRLRSVTAGGAAIAAAVLCVSSCAASVPPVGAEHGMVVTAQQIASKVGVDVLKKGGNAVDAAVAVGYALAVVYAAAGNL